MSIHYRIKRIESFYNQRKNKMTSQDFIANLPINNFHRFVDYEEWLDFYSHHYPKEDPHKQFLDTTVLWCCIRSPSD